MIKNKQTLPNGTFTAQLDKSLNGTTRGNLVFLLNKSPSYLWSNPLAKVLTKNNTDKKIQWQFNTGSSNTMASTGPASSAPRPAAPPAGGGGPKPPASGGNKPPASPPAASGGGAPKPGGAAPPSSGGGKPPAPSGGG